MATNPELFGSGRSADIYDLGDGRVSRRKRDGHIAAAEAVVMTTVREAGFPVPHVHSVDGCDMVMDRIDGVDLLSRLAKRPWEARKGGSVLADLHRRLAAIPIEANELYALWGQPESFVHGDLHPGMS